MRILFILIVALSASLSFAQETLESEVSRFSIEQKTKLTKQYNEFINKEFPNGFYCEPVGDIPSNDINLAIFCNQIAKTENQNITNQTWMKSFEIGSLDSDTKTFYKRYLVPDSNPTGDSLCDIDAMIDDKDQIVFSVYCD